MKSFFNSSNSFDFLARSCGTPTEIVNGWHTGECFTFNCKATYHCEDGYELVPEGRAEKTCQADGTWSPKELPSCVRKLLQQI